MLLYEWYSSLKLNKSKFQVFFNYFTYIDIINTINTLKIYNISIKKYVFVKNVTNYMK